MTTQIKDLEKAVRMAKKKELQQQILYASVQSETIKAKVALLQARAESMGFGVGARVCLSNDGKTVHGEVMGFSYGYGKAIIQIAPLTRAGKPHATYLLVSYWEDRYKRFSDDLRLEEVGMDTGEKG